MLSRHFTVSVHDIMSYMMQPAHFNGTTDILLNSEALRPSACNSTQVLHVKSWAMAVDYCQLYRRWGKFQRKQLRCYRDAGTPGFSNFVRPLDGRETWAGNGSVGWAGAGGAGRAGAGARLFCCWWFVDSVGDGEVDMCFSGLGAVQRQMLCALCEEFNLGYVCREEGGTRALYVTRYPAQCAKFAKENELYALCDELQLGYVCRKEADGTRVLYITRHPE